MVPQRLFSKYALQPYVASTFHTWLYPDGAWLNSRRDYIIKLNSHGLGNSYGMIAGSGPCSPLYFVMTTHHNHILRRWRSLKEAGGTRCCAHWSAPCAASWAIGQARWGALKPCAVWDTS
jgi:hypothetical protein